MILGITNRTENWKTARHFVPLCKDGDALLALVQRLGEPEGLLPSEVGIELFWKGVRDYLHEHNSGSEHDPEDWARRYECLFPNLSQRCFGRLHGRENYDRKQWARQENWAKKLFANLCNTEVDVVIETPSSLFIGEAKHEMGFGADRRLVLVHQLIRQYVTASVLADKLKCEGQGERKIVPFVVVDDVKRSRRFEQVRFMCRQGWLRKENVLGWKEVKDLGSRRGESRAWFPSTQISA